MRADSTYVAIAKFESLFGPGSCAVSTISGETAVLVGLADSSHYFLRLQTLCPANGARLGRTVEVPLPAGSCFPPSPRRVLYSQYFVPGFLVVMGRGMELGFLPITIGADGTPSTATWSCSPARADTSVVGAAVAIAEMPGLGFADRRPRLVIATEKGQLVVLVRTINGLLTLENIVANAGVQKISDLGAIPQWGRVLLGIASENHIRGLAGIEASPTPVFALYNPEGRPIRSFRFFDPADRALQSPDAELTLAFCDGLTSRVHFAHVPAQVYGEKWLDTLADPAMEPPAPAPGLPYTGSLVLLPANGRDVYYRPGYIDGTGIPGCVVNVAGDDSTACSPCSIAMTGDVDLSGRINTGDAIYLVNAVFKGGLMPRPCAASGDVNCSGMLNAGDLIYLINYMFKNGPPPCNVCSLFAGTWDCP